MEFLMTRVVPKALITKLRYSPDMGALMLSISINHPDSEEFITKKQDLTKVTGANISVKLTDEFMQAAMEGKDYFLRYPVDLNVAGFNTDDYGYGELVDLGGKHYIKKVNAGELWKTVIHCAWRTAEPGLMFETPMHDYAPDGVYPELRMVSTNPCVTAETTLLTKNGYKPIWTLVGSDVEIWNGNDWTLVNPFKTADSAKVYKVTFSDGSSLKCTSSHKFVLKDKSRKSLQELREGDVLDSFIYPNIPFNRNEMIRDYTPYTEGFLLGMYVGSVDDEYASRFINMNSKADLIDSRVKEATADKQEYSYKAHVRRMLNFHGYYYYSNIVDGSEFVKGIMDASGSMNDEEFIILGGYDNLSMVANIFSLNGIHCTINDDKLENAYLLSIHGKDLENLNEWLESKGQCTHACAVEGLSIVSIEEWGEEATYCVTDEKNHTALFNRIKTGQCG